MKTVLLKCVEPFRRDALEEAAKLALTFVTVTTAPGYPDFKPSRDLKFHISSLALEHGCHLPDLAHELLEAIQAHGIEVMRVPQPKGEVTAEWKDWWDDLPEAGDEDFELELDIR